MGELAEIMVWHIWDTAVSLYCGGGGVGRAVPVPHPLALTTHLAALVAVVLHDALHSAHELALKRCHVRVRLDRVARIEGALQLHPPLRGGRQRVHLVRGVGQRVEAGTPSKVVGAEADHVHVLPHVHLGAHGRGAGDGALDERREQQADPRGERAGVGAAEGDPLRAPRVLLLVEPLAEGGQVVERLQVRQVLQVGVAHVPGWVALREGGEAHMQRLPGVTGVAPCRRSGAPAPP